MTSKSSKIKILNLFKFEHEAKYKKALSDVKVSNVHCTGWACNVHCTDLACQYWTIELKCGRRRTRKKLTGVQN